MNIIYLKAESKDILSNLYRYSVHFIKIINADYCIGEPYASYLYVYFKGMPTDSLESLIASLYFVAVSI